MSWKRKWVLNFKSTSFIIIVLIIFLIVCSLFLYLKTIGILEVSDDKTKIRFFVPSGYYSNSLAHSLPAIIMDPLPNVKVLIWPRIPKTGGKNLLDLLNSLINSDEQRLMITDAGSAYVEDKINYSFVPREKFDRESLDWSELTEYYEMVIRKFNDSNKLFLIQYHASFLYMDLSNTLNMRSNEVMYISMIRNPINRIVSSFYYLRGQSGGWRAQSKSAYNQCYVPKILEMQNNFSIDECVRGYGLGNNVCAFSTNYYVKWFCGGLGDKCDPLNINEDSYDLAIENIDKYFAWIGVLEYYRNSVYALYDRFPFFFRHFRNRQEFAQTFERMNQHSERYRRSIGYGGYQRPMQESVDILTRKNSLDVKLYDYVIEKFRLKDQ